MCFSAGASFAGALVLGATGVATLKTNRSADSRLFASVPVIFALQQAAEGLVWLALKNSVSGPALLIPVYTFLITAVVIWPVMMPSALLRMEKIPGRRKALKLFIAAGVVTSIYYGSGLMLYSVRPEISDFHIRYGSDFPEAYQIPAFLLYLSATIIPFFISGKRRMWLMGLLIFVSCLLTGLFYKEYLTSVWCFFAAIISVVVFWILRDDAKKIVVSTAA